MNPHNVTFHRSDQAELFPLPARDTTERPEATIRRYRQPNSEYAAAFGRFWGLFRRQLLDSYGGRSEGIITNAKTKSGDHTPGQDIDTLNDDTAATLLDIVEIIINEASIMKRSRLTLTAITLISDLYNKHYAVLERHGVIARVEQAYIRIRR